MNTPFNYNRITILLMAILLCFTACSKVIQPTYSDLIVEETASNQIEQIYQTNQGPSGITAREIISNAPIYYTENHITTEAQQFEAAEINATYPLIQSISPIVQPDTLPINATETPVISKENNAALTLGIIAILFPLIAIILAPIGLSKAAKARKQILENPQKYTGKNQLNLAVALNIIALVLFIILIAYLFVMALFLIQML